MPYNDRHDKDDSIEFHTPYTIHHCYPSKICPGSSVLGIRGGASSGAPKGNNVEVVAFVVAPVGILWLQL